MGEDRNVRDRVVFRDVLLARLYLGELRNTGGLSPELQAEVHERGAEHIERLAKIIANSDVAHGYVEQRAHEFAAHVVSILKAKRDSANSKEAGPVDSSREFAARKADEKSHE